MENETLPADNRLYALTGRVSRLEKDVEFLSTLLLTGVIVAAYFGVRWYMANVANIPGVES
jgi:hypothetical protein